MSEQPNDKVTFVLGKVFTVDELESIIIAPGITAKNASDRQFYDWAESLSPAFEIVENADQPWPLKNRAELCSYLVDEIEEWKKNHE